MRLPELLCSVINVTVHYLRAFFLNICTPVIFCTLLFCNEFVNAIFNMQKNQHFKIIVLLFKENSCGNKFARIVCLQLSIVA